MVILAVLSATLMTACGAAAVGGLPGYYCRGICSTLTILNRSEHATRHGWKGWCLSSPMMLTFARVRADVPQPVFQIVAVLM